MRRVRPAIWALIGVIVAAAVIVTVLVVTNRNPSPPHGVAQDRAATIPVDGAEISAEVITPAGTGTAPLVVMPAAWGGGAAMYHAIGTELAQAGYQVVAYAQRGFGRSTGKVDFAGQPTQSDASAVIDWALTHTRADPHHIGMLGLSYGAGMSLLTAAHDKRVRAVVAFSTWTDLAGALDQNSTPNVAAVRLLVGPSQRATFDASLSPLRRALTSAPTQLGAALQAISPLRSPDSYVADLNRNKPAIMISNAFEDSLLNPTQVVSFFDKLTTPKRLELSAGDHGGPSIAGLSGKTSPAVTDGRKWLDHYLRGADNGIDKQPPILLRDIRTSQSHTFTSWPGSPGVRTYLPAPTTPVDANTPATWSAVLHQGVDSGADVGPSRYEPSALYTPPRIGIAAISPKKAALWTGPPMAAAKALNGTPVLRLNVASSSTAATLYAYLYDVGPGGGGTLLDMAPFSVTGMTPNQARDVTVELAPTSYTVPAGHRIALVIDAADPRYQSLAATGTTITVSSTAAAPASLTLPLSG